MLGGGGARFLQLAVRKEAEMPSADRASMLLFLLRRGEQDGCRFQMPFSSCYRAQYEDM